ncbi:MAG: hypothetical protein ABIF08_02700 [Nanoarchaeota archaeon]
MKGQAAFEYIMIFIIVLAFVVPVWFYLITVQTDTTTELHLTYAKIAVENIAEKADLVYSQGAPAKVTIKVYMPKNIINASIVSKTVLLNMKVNSHDTFVTATSTATLDGYLPQTEGVYIFEIEAIDGVVNICPKGDEFAGFC